MTHRLSAVLRFAKRATVLRDEVGATGLTRSEMSRESLIEAIMGQQLNDATTQERLGQASAVGVSDSHADVMVLSGEGDA